MPGIYSGISEEQQVKIIELWKQGYAGTEIGRMLGFSGSTASKFIRRYVENEDKKSIDMEAYERLKPTFDGGKIRALHNAHWSAKEIAHDMVLDEVYVLQYMKEEGIIK